MRKNKEMELKIKHMLPPEDKALVFVIRRSTNAKLMKVTLECNGKYIGTTKGKQFIYLILDPGSYTFVTKAKNKSCLQLDLEAGHSYFISEKINAWGIGVLTELELMEETTGRKKLKKCSLIEINNIQETVPSSYEYTQESLAPKPLTSKERTKYCIIAIIIIIIAIIIMISGLIDIMGV